MIVGDEGDMVSQKKSKPTREKKNEESTFANFVCSHNLEVDTLVW